jgi:hypothetical protein
MQRFGEDSFLEEEEAQREILAAAHTIGYSGEELTLKDRRGNA